MALRAHKQKTMHAKNKRREKKGKERGIRHGKPKREGRPGFMERGSAVGGPATQLLKKNDYLL